MTKRNFIVTSLMDCYRPVNQDNMNPIFSIDDAIVRYGYYLTKDEYIFTESLHENFGPKWIKYWTRERGNSFGGLDASDLELNHGGKTINLYSNGDSITYVEEEGYLFQYTYDHNFHHFIVSALPRLFHYITLYKGTKKVIIRDDTPSYQLEIIRHLVSEEQLYYISPTKNYQFAKIFIAPFPQWTNPSQISNFFSVAFPSKNDFAVDKNNLIFLSRSDAADKRPISNETQLDALLKQHSFQLVVTSGLSFTDRLNLFDKAEVIVGVFSAGFANLVFANNCKTVVFIEHPIYKIPLEYKNLCAARNIKLYVMKNSQIRSVIYRILSRLSWRNPRSLQNPHNNKSWSVNLNRLSKLLNKISREGA